MAFMRSLEERYLRAKATGSLDRALKRWRKVEPAFGPFHDIDQLVGACRSADGRRQAKEQVIGALCEGAEAGDQEAALLLIWLFIGAFRRIRTRIGSAPLSEEDLEAEMLAGFWDGVAEDASTRPSTRIFYAILRRAWVAVTEASKASVEEPGNVPECRTLSSGAEGDLLLNQAREEGILTPEDVRLIKATRLEGWKVSEIADSTGDTREAISMRRKRAEKKLAAWLSDAL